ncbi:putative tetratricopeptide-like helical domain superfamily [Helianthus annuus]|nr:putative tetratricopeptide-like helical domain superfamily [Helianthus annuus]
MLLFMTLTFFMEQKASNFIFFPVVLWDKNRAEEYFKKATKIEPKDAEAFNKYASFLWHAKNDLWAAEESFLEAISADPNNPFYTATYSHFLWSNGADDTCFPLGSPENVNSDEA